jgi:SAM-dependent methyltransferase
MHFFNDFPRFYRTSQTSPLPDRLNARHEAIIARNLPQLSGKRVLDIASHDGRWTFAALKAGATHVIGIEPRQELIDNARITFREYGIADGTHELWTSKVMDVMDGIAVDTVLCLGYYYHTVQHAELLDKIERTGARFVVIDTEIVPPQDSQPPVSSDEPRLVFGNPHAIQLIRDQVDDQQMAFADSLTRNGYTLAARPSRAAIHYLAAHFGFRVSEFDWPSYFHKHPTHATSMVDYSEGWRSTFYLERIEA